MIPNLTHKILYPTAIFGTVATVILAQPNIAYSLSPYDIGAIAKKITVRITGQADPGSGVIIAKQGDTYYVLTAGHVIKGTNPGEQADITTYNGKVHEIDTQKIIFFPDVDLALVQFTSEDNYTTAEIGESDKLKELSMVYVAGYPLSGKTISGGKFTINDGKISSINFNNEGGYDLVYNNPTITGMSGGPVLNEEGQLVAIHGQAEEQKGGFNLGIPIKIFMVSASDVGINIQQKKNTLDLQIASNQGGSGVNNTPVAINKPTPTPPPSNTPVAINTNNQFQFPPSQWGNDKPTPTPPPTDNSTSPPKLGGSGGVNTANVSLIAAAPNANKELMYQRLEQYLADGNFRKADEQTWALMNQVGENGKDKNYDWLSHDEILNFSCRDLGKIDNLWVKYSGGKFGFSVQRDIYASVGGNVNNAYNDPIETWERFAIAVGWKTGSGTSSDNFVKIWDIFDLALETTGRRGHLPYYMDTALVNIRGAYFFRHANCNL